MVKQVLSALLVGFIAGGIMLVEGCAGGQLDPRAQRAADRVECVVRVVQPYCGDVLDARQTVLDWFQGKGDLRRTLLLLGATAPELQAIGMQIEACQAAPAPAKPDAGLVHT